jgi:hypothetical protein
MVCRTPIPIMPKQQENMFVKATISKGENMPEIQSLALRVRDLTQSVDRWNTVMIWALIFAAIAAIAVVLATRIVVTQGKKLADAQTDLINAKDAKLALDLKTKDGEIAGAVKNAAEANERATKAQASLSLAEQHAAEANAKAEGFRLDISKANERAASANETAERERLARLQLEARLADRVLTPAQQAAITSRLAALSGIVVDALVWGDTPEIQIISGQVLEAIRKAGWSVHTGQAGGGGAAVRGMLIGTRAGADENAVRAGNLIASALQSAGLAAGPWPFEQLQQPAIVFNSDFSGTAPIRLFIGSKP